MAIEIGRGYRVEVGTALAVAVAATGVSKATEAVVSGTGFTVGAGDFVMFGAVDGMPELGFIVARVKASPAPTATAFTLEGINSTAWGTFISGSFQRITTWSTLAQATSIDFGAGTVDNLEITTLLDVVKQSAAGMLTQPDITINLFSDAAASVQGALDDAAYLGSVLPFRGVRASGQRRCFAGVPSTVGESANVNQPITGSVTVVVRSNRIVKYTT